MLYDTGDGKVHRKFGGRIRVAYQSRKTDHFGSILRVRVRLDVSKPLRHCILIKLEGKIVDIGIRYEKLPSTCFLCGMMNHVEDRCDRYQISGCDDKQKPYGHWFQKDILLPEYKRPLGKRFGLGPEPGWVMKVIGEEADKAAKMVFDDDSSRIGDDRRKEKKTEAESSKE